MNSFTYHRCLRPRDYLSLILCVVVTFTSPVSLSAAGGVFVSVGDRGADVQIASGDLWPNFDRGDRNDFRRSALRVVSTVAGAALGFSAGGIIGLLAGGIAGYLVSGPVAKDLFPNRAVESRRQWSDNRAFQRGLVVQVGEDGRTTIRNGFIGGDPNADLGALHDRYYRTLQDYEDAVREGDPGRISRCRNAYIHARSEWLRARGISVNPPTLR